MISVSCSTKFHSFALAEQFQRYSLLDSLYTVYHSRKNTLLARFNGRRDNEAIPLNKVVTYPWLAPIFRLRSDHFRNNALFDNLVSRDLLKNESKVVIGWSGMSLDTIKQAKRLNKLTILERGSAHISVQMELLNDEYGLYGERFVRDERTEMKELEEYDQVDFITVPSMFAKNSFVTKGYDGERIFINNFGSNSLFEPSPKRNPKFTILYVGGLTIQKGMLHLFTALKMLKWPLELYEVWFIGGISTEIKKIIPRFQSGNWKFYGHLPQATLAQLVPLCHVMVHPSIQEGLSMVIPQMMASGVPVVATENTGGADIIADGVDGYIVPIRSPEKISEKLNCLFEDRILLETMRNRASQKARGFGNWDRYGDRYSEFIHSILKADKTTGG